MDADPLPPTGEEGDAVFVASIGWCGGHGEAVLDDERRIRYRDDRPIYVDSRSWQAIEERLDLSGTWSGSPSAWVSARIRLDPRRARNHTIPGGPREDYMALVVLAVAEVEVIGDPL